MALLCDEDKQVVRAYGVWGPKKFMGREYEGISRVSFLIDEQGTIQHRFDTVQAAVHAQEVLDLL